MSEGVSGDGALVCVEAADGMEDSRIAIVRDRPTRREFHSIHAAGTDVERGR